jgi:putative transposase
MTPSKDRKTWPHQLGNGAVESKSAWRSSACYAPVPEMDKTLTPMTDETFMECPRYGSRQVARHLRRAGHEVGRRRVMATDGEDELITDLPAGAHVRSAPAHRVYP